MPDLMIKVSRDLAEQIKRGQDISKDDLGRTLTQYGAILSRPLQKNEGELAQFFQVEQVAGDRMDALRQALAGLSGIEAAYIKPDAELP